MAPPVNDLGHPPDVTVLTVSRETAVQNSHMVTMEMIVVIIGGSKGGRQGRAPPPPGGPNSFIFMQFSAKM